MSSNLVYGANDMMKRWCIALLLVTTVSLQASTTTYDPTDQYVVHNVRGWTVRVNQRLINHDPKLTEQTLELLDHQLYKMERRLPAQAIEKLRSVPIWVELEDKRHPCMCYHPSREWLSANGYNPEKAGSVEVANAATFLKWTLNQPYMVMHEFAHAYHHLVLPGGNDNEYVRRTYEAAKASGRYENVISITGREARHYAMTNQMEYFAELTESYFATNDFYPFVRPELKQFDPEGYAMIERLWNDPMAGVETAKSSDTGAPNAKD